MRSILVALVVLFIVVTIGYFMFRKEAVSPSQLPGAPEPQGADLIEEGDSIEWLGVR